VLVGGKRYWLVALLAGMAATAVVRSLLTGLQRTYLLKLFMKLGVTMSTNFMWHSLRLPISFYFARMPGELAGRVHTNDEVATTLSGRLSGVVLDLLLVVFYGLFMAYLDPWLTPLRLVTVGV